MAEPALQPSRSVSNVTVPTQKPVGQPQQKAEVATIVSNSPAEVTITFAGKVAFESNIADSVYDMQMRTCDFQDVLAGIADENLGEIRIVALPQVYTAEGRKYTDNQVQQTAAAEVHHAGFNVGVIPGNVLSNGAQSVLDTAGTLYSHGLVPCGINSPVSTQTVIFEQNGMQIALISHTEKMSSKASSALQSTAGQGVLTSVTDEELYQAIADAKAQGCQCVIVYYHWNQTNTVKVTDQMRSKAMDMTAAGADIIVGIGPSRLLPAAKLRTADANGVERESLVLYSMGTLLSESREGNDLSGALVHVTVREKGNGIVIADISYTSTYIWKQRFQGVDLYRVINSAGEYPPQMSESQKDVMDRCKGRTDNNLGILHTLEFGE